MYDFTRGRKKAGPARFLKHFSGYLQADAYGGYKHLYTSDIQEVGCWAHARRKFVEACDLTTTPGRAHYAVKVIQQLYRIERECADAGLDHDEKKAYRQEQAKPVLDHFKAWLDQQATAVLPRGKLYKAIRYALNQWESLNRYLDAGYLNIDNNWAEQSMRPIALGRKNYLFVGSERSGRSTANLYSLVETCKANGINPQGYLAYILDRLPGAKTEEALAQLLPYAQRMAERFPMAKT